MKLKLIAYMIYERIDLANIHINNKTPSLHIMGEHGEKGGIKKH